MWTEAEAETKWCAPFAPFPNKYVFDTVDTYDYTMLDTRSGNPHAGGRITCIASECMLWRWADALQTRGYCGFGGPAPGYDAAVSEGRERAHARAVAGTGRRGR